MDQHTLDILEFRRIREFLAIYATSSLGKSLAAEIQPDTDMGRIKVWQKQVTELRDIIGDNRLPLGGIRDIRPFLAELDDPASVLGCEALLDIHSTLQAARHIRDYLGNLDDRYPKLSQLGQKIGEFRDIENAIFSSVDSGGKIKNNATPKLHSIRKEIEVKRARIRSKLQSLVRSPRMGHYLQGGTITIRKGRLVIPVKAKFRDNISGIIRDQSDSGETVFIEPSTTSSAGDDLQRLLTEEKQEIFRILQEITENIRAKQEKISRTVRMLSTVDLIHAKACFSIDFDMSEPELNDDGRIDIKEARHPLLMYDRGWGRRPVGEAVEDHKSDRDSVVPINVRLGDGFDILVVTGPNTGGKTVTLKTIGLLNLMAQAGLHIPAASGSYMAVFSDILADIGDEQSLQQNLSTFSSHLTQIVRILDQAGERALVLLDELGTGTDPQEGAALGIAIIDFLYKNGSRAVATTHLRALKTYAHAHPRIENASVEFDMETLQPTYRLLIGAFGSSNALAIAQRLGLPMDVISRASDLVQDDDERVEDLINSLQQVKSQLEEEREKLSIEREEAESLKSHYESLLQTIQEREGELVPVGAEQKEAEPVQATFASLERGDMVRIRSLNTVGEVIGKMRDRDRIIVRTNMMKVEVKPEDLEMAADE